MVQYSLTIERSKNEYALLEFRGGGEYLAAERQSLSHCEKEKICYTSDMKNHFESIKKGFTLAEVLITLGVIGVVTALTLPSLVAKYKNMQYVSMLKKNYTEISQVLVQIEAKDGSVAELLNEISTNDFMKDYLYPKLNGAKFYDPKGSYAFVMCGCNNLLAYKWRGPNKQEITSGPFPATSTSSIMLNNGACVVIWNEYSAYALTIDINGPSGKPNIMGYDLHKFYITNNGIKPFGYNMSISNIISNCPDNPNEKGAGGHYCTARIVQDGWQMKYR